MLSLISLIENLGLKQEQALFFKKFILKILKQTIWPIMCFTLLPNYFEPHFKFPFITSAAQLGLASGYITNLLAPCHPKWSRGSAGMASLALAFVRCTWWCSKHTQINPKYIIKNHPPRGKSMSALIWPVANFLR